MLAPFARIVLIGALALVPGASPESMRSRDLATRPAAPVGGAIYHGAHPGGPSGEEDDLTPADVTAYEQAVGRQVAWVYFSHNWCRGRSFPTATATWIRERGSVPFVRLMMRSDAEQNHAEPVFTLDRIIAGDFDGDLREWARGARDFGTPLLVEYGTEVNGEWFPWNGAWNGGGTPGGYGDPAFPDGPERFRDAYRRIVSLCRAEGARNLAWVFHANDASIPDEPWNAVGNYYPGDDWVDWLAVSVYGAQTPLADEWPDFATLLDDAYPRLAALSPTRPIIVAEFAVTSGNPLGHQAQWADAALANLIGRRWPRIVGFSWWNEVWQNDDEPSHDTNMRVQDNPTLSAVFTARLANPGVISRPLFAQPARRKLSRR